ncbi:NAD(P)H-dependent oxidoreductase [Stappia sp. ES.058]|uniref:NAD(P)H-dependent oxidoreductase n=1 Tax=Stappia sp. ES.058 TaxID=1881061 RepID=UPI00087C121A|nr:NAD(P)H-dependent oxidoreductase [Stappia sp. ES.058]SDU38114.1 Putative NADPH-quinone reductase (modulator of drug activity B) [Stappia sp. ES.058]
MARRILVLDGHPGADSLCGAIAQAYAEAAEAAGSEVRVLRLGEMDFDIDMESGYGSKKPLEPCLEEVQDALTWCEHLAIAHPLWWGGVPAKLKGLFDRVLLPRFAYSYEKGKALPTPHLTGRTAEVLVTADTPRWYLYLVIHAPGYRVMRKQILGFCGFRKIRFRTFSPVQGSSEQDRRGFLARAARLGRAA